MNILFKKSGFTIVELLIVITVIGILAGITAVAYSGLTNRAKSNQYLAEVDQMEKLIQSNYVLRQNVLKNSESTCMVKSIEALPATDTFPEGACLVMEQDGVYIPIISYDSAVSDAMPSGIKKELPTNSLAEVSVIYQGYVKYKVRGIGITFGRDNNNPLISLTWGAPTRDTCGRGYDGNSMADYIPEESKEVFLQEMHDMQAAIDNGGLDEDTLLEYRAMITYYDALLYGSDHSLCFREIQLWGRRA